MFKCSHRTNLKFIHKKSSFSCPILLFFLHLQPAHPQLAEVPAVPGWFSGGGGERDTPATVHRVAPASHVAGQAGPRKTQPPKHRRQILVGEDGQGEESSSATGWAAERGQPALLRTPHLDLELTVKGCVRGAASLVLGERPAPLPASSTAPLPGSPGEEELQPWGLPWCFTGCPDDSPEWWECRNRGKLCGGVT